MVATLDKLYASQNIVFEVDINADMRVRIDSSDLLDVLGNVLDNACKYGADHIIIRSHGDDVLTIGDNGPGWPPGDPERLIARGARADTGVPGDGTGLAASRGLMESYGGRLALSHGDAHEVAHGGARINDPGNAQEDDQRGDLGGDLGGDLVNIQEDNHDGARSRAVKDAHAEASGAKVVLTFTSR